MMPTNVFLNRSSNKWLIGERDSVLTWERHDFPHLCCLHSSPRYITIAVFVSMVAVNPCPLPFHSIFCLGFMLDS